MFNLFYKHVQHSSQEDSTFVKNMFNIWVSHVKLNVEIAQSKCLYCTTRTLKLHNSNVEHRDDRVQSSPPPPQKKILGPGAVGPLALGNVRACVFYFFCWINVPTFWHVISFVFCLEFAKLQHKIRIILSHYLTCIKVSLHDFIGYGRLYLTCILARRCRAPRKLGQCEAIFLNLSSAFSMNNARVHLDTI
jgi:hypothetical protein